MVHISLILCIKMGVYLTNPKQLAAIPSFGHTQILHMLVSVVVLLLRLLLSHPGMMALNFACGINEVLTTTTTTQPPKTNKQTNKLSRCIIFFTMRKTRVTIFSESASVTSTKPLQVQAYSLVYFHLT